MNRLFLLSATVGGFFLGVNGFDKEYDKQIDELKNNTPALPTEEVEKLKKEHSKYLFDNKV